MTQRWPARRCGAWAASPPKSAGQVRLGGCGWCSCSFLTDPMSTTRRVRLLSPVARPDGFCGGGTSTGERRSRDDFDIYVAWPPEVVSPTPGPASASSPKPAFRSPVPVQCSMPVHSRPTAVVHEAEPVLARHRRRGAARPNQRHCGGRGRPTTSSARCVQGLNPTTRPTSFSHTDLRPGRSASHPAPPHSPNSSEATAAAGAPESPRVCPSEPEVETAASPSGSRPIRGGGSRGPCRAGGTTSRARTHARARLRRSLRAHAATASRFHPGS